MSKKNDILKDIETEFLLRMERMPVKVTPEIAKQTALKLRDAIEQHKFSQGEVAKKFGVSTAKLSQFLGGKYTAQKGIEELVNKSLQFIESLGRKQRAHKPPSFVETTVAKRIAAIITRTETLSDEDEGKVGIIIGDGGHGKSVCLRQYAKANKNSMYLELDDAMTSTTMFDEICDKLSVDNYGHLATITRRLIEALAYRHIIIILDEASGLTVKQLNQLRQIIVIKAHCPLILSGNSDLLKTIMQPKTRRGCESLDQFTSRLSYILNLDESASNKDGGIYTAEDIRKLYEYGGIRLVSDAIGTLRKICRSPRSGRLRTCSNIITALHTSRKILRAGFITTKDIAGAIEELRLPVRVWLPLAIREPQAEREEVAAVAKAG